MLEIQAIPALSDNYIWLLINEGHAIVVDPGEAAQVLAILKAKNLRLSAILLTHKHNDHTGGAAELLAQFPAPVFSSKQDQVACTTDYVSEGQVIHLEHWPDIKVFAIPGHTLGHVMYLINDCLFCGDTLFGAGCGRIFEGTPEQMFATLAKIKALPDHTRIYCGHEYTLKNLGFANMAEPDNPDITKRIQDTENLRAQNQPSLPSTLALEKATNPFLRCDQATLKAKAEQHTGQALANELAVFTSLRQWRNTY